MVFTFRCLQPQSSNFTFVNIHLYHRPTGETPESQAVGAFERRKPGPRLQLPQPHAGPGGARTRSRPVASTAVPLKGTGNLRPTSVPRGRICSCHPPGLSGDMCLGAGRVQSSRGRLTSSAHSWGGVGRNGVSSKNGAQNYSMSQQPHFWFHAQKN